MILNVGLQEACIEYLNRRETKNEIHHDDSKQQTRNNNKDEFSFLKVQ